MPASTLKFTLYEPAVEVEHDSESMLVTPVSNLSSARQS